MRILRQGTTIRGKRGFYEIERVLLVSSMSLLYLGKSSRGENVLVKTARVENDGGDYIRSNLLKLEAEILRQVNHENVVRYLDEAQLDDAHYLFTEFILGRRMLEAYKGKTASLEEFRLLSSKLLEVVGYLHSCGIVHRDINPKNIILDENRKLVLIDFGAAQKVGSEWTKNIKVGTRGWSAPEQFDKMPIAGPRSDIYAVGSVLFYLWTGEEPSKYLRKDGTLNQPLNVHSSIPRAVFSIIQKAMLPELARRYLNTNEVREDLDRIVSVRLRFGDETWPEKVAGVQLVFKDRVIRIENPAQIGRRHRCGFACEVRGFKSPPDIMVDDEAKYVSKHHAQLLIDKNGKTAIVDLGSSNGTAIRKAGGSFVVLNTNAPENIGDGDEIALAYSLKRGPHMSFTVRLG